MKIWLGVVVGCALAACAREHSTHGPATVPGALKLTYTVTATPDHSALRLDYTIENPTSEAVFVLDELTTTSCRASWSSPTA